MARINDESEPGEKYEKIMEKRSVDTYIKDGSLRADLIKRKHAAVMAGDEEAAFEVREAQYALESKEKVSFVEASKYKLAEGKLKAILEREYVADSEGPKSIALRILTYEQGVLGVNQDATLSVSKDENGNPIENKGRYLTVNGYVPKEDWKDAPNALYAEAAAQPNLELMAKLQSEHADLVKDAFKDGTPIMFQPRVRKNLNDLI